MIFRECHSSNFWATIAGSKMMSCNFLVYNIIYIIHIHIYIYINVYSLYLIVLSGSAMSLSTALSWN